MVGWLGKLVCTHSRTCRRFLKCPALCLYCSLGKRRLSGAGIYGGRRE